MNILDKRFKYTPAVSTDIRRLFKRVRKQLAGERARETADVLLYRSATKKESRK